MKNIKAVAILTLALGLLLAACTGQTTLKDMDAPVRLFTWQLNG